MQWSLLQNMCNEQTVKNGKIDTTEREFGSSNAPAMQGPSRYAWKCQGSSGQMAFTNNCNLLIHRPPTESCIPHHLLPTSCMCDLCYQKCFQFVHLHTTCWLSPRRRKSASCIPAKNKASLTGCGYTRLKQGQSHRVWLHKTKARPVSQGVDTQD